MHRYQRLLRMHQMIIAGRHPSVKDFCEQFKVSRRTVLEDIRYLRERLGEPILWDSFRRGYGYANLRDDLDFHLDEDEVLGLLLGQAMLAEYSGPSFLPILHNASDKLCKGLPQSLVGRLDFTNSWMEFKTFAAIEFDVQALYQLMRAIQQQHPVNIEYFSAHAGRTNQRMVNPYRCVHSCDTWYFIGHCHWRGEKRIFALHRIRKLQVVTDIIFDPEPRLHLDRWINSAFLVMHDGGREKNYAIRFSPKAATYISERAWSPSQSLVHDANDGSCTLFFTATSVDEVKRWVMPWGSDAVVLHPPELKDALLVEFEKAARLYTDDV